MGWWDNSIGTALDWQPWDTPVNPHSKGRALIAGCSWCSMLSCHMWTSNYLSRQIHRNGKTVWVQLTPYSAIWFVCINSSLLVILLEFSTHAATHWGDNPALGVSVSPWVQPLLTCLIGSTWLIGSCAVTSLSNGIYLAYWELRCLFLIWLNLINWLGVELSLHLAYLDFGSCLPVWYYLVDAVF